MTRLVASKKKRTLTALLGGIFALGLVAGCTTSAPDAPAAPDADSGEAAEDTAQDTLEKAISNGYLRVAIANEPPYTEVSASGEVSGVEPDVLAAVLDSMGIPEIEGVVTPYDAMVPGLNADRWDVIAAGLFMKQSRCEAVSYSEPVIVSTESFGVPVGNPKNVQTIQDVLDDDSLKVAVLTGAFEEGILTTAGVPDKQIVAVKDSRSGMEAVSAGRADAFLLPTLSLRELVETDNKIEVTEPIADAPKTGSGAAFRKSDTELRDAYNVALAEFKETQEFRDILEGWGFDPDHVVGVTAEELCQNEG